MVHEVSSFYALEVFIAPGGSRKADCYVFDNLEDVARALEADLSKSSNVYLVVVQGESIRLTAYEDGAPVKQINMLPYITIDVPGYPTIAFDRHGELLGFDMEADVEVGDEDEDEISTMRLFTYKAGHIAVRIDWEAAAIPALKGARIAPGEEVELRSDFLRGTATVRYGYNSLL